MSKFYIFALRTLDYVLTASYDLHNGLPHPGRIGTASSRVSLCYGHGLCEKIRLLLMSQVPLSCWQDAPLVLARAPANGVSLSARQWMPDVVSFLEVNQSSVQSPSKLYIRSCFQPFLVISRQSMLCTNSLSIKEFRNGPRSVHIFTISTTWQQP